MQDGQVVQVSRSQISSLDPGEISSVQERIQGGQSLSQQNLVPRGSLVGAFVGGY